MCSMNQRVWKVKNETRLVTCCQECQQLAQDGEKVVVLNKCNELANADCRDNDIIINSWD